MKISLVLQRHTMIGAILIASAALGGCETDRGGELLAPLLFSEPNTPQESLYEPDNNTMSGALRLTDDGNLHRSTFHLLTDLDYYVFAAAQGAPYTIETDELDAGVDTRIALMSVYGGTLLLNDEASEEEPDRSCISWTPAQSGDYYLEARTSGGQPGWYGVRITSGEDSYEPDDVLANASEVGPDGRGQFRTFHSSADIDLARFSVHEGLEYVVKATYELPLEGGSGAHTVSVLDSTGAVVAHDEGSGYARFTAASDGIAYARAISADALGTYQLSVTISSDTYEPDDTPADAKWIGVGSRQRRALGPGDVDMATFGATNALTYRIASDSLSEGVDTRITVMTAGSVALASDDDSGEGEASELVWTATSTAEHYVRVTSAEGGRSGTYSLLISIVPGDQ